MQIARSRVLLWSCYRAHLGPIGPRWAPCWPHAIKVDHTNPVLVLTQPVTEVICIDHTFSRSSTANMFTWYVRSVAHALKRRKIIHNPRIKNYTLQILHEYALAHWEVSRFHFNLIRFLCVMHNMMVKCRETLWIFDVATSSPDIPGKGNTHGAIWIYIVAR